MSVEQNRAVARRFVEELLGKGNYQLFDELTVENYVDHNLPPGITPQQGIGAFRAGFPDARFKVEDIVAEGEKVVVRYAINGTHTADFLGIPPTGKMIYMTGMSMYRVVDGKLTDGWVQYDQLGLMQQLGVVPMPN
jgi:predicted ester cyclase